MDESKERLLEASSECDDSQLGVSDHRYQRPAQSFWRARCSSIIITSLLIYIAILETANIALFRSRCPSPPDEPYSLTKGILEYEERAEWEPYTYPWKQEPSDELDAMWADLLYANNIKVTAEELDLLHENKTDRVQVTGGDYASVLGIFHHLHCLNVLRQVVHWDYYESKNLSSSPEVYDVAHQDHCIDAMRQTLMCHANVIPYTAQWFNDPKRPLSKDLESDQQTMCLKWDSLNDWARERALVPGEFKYLPSPYHYNKNSGN